MGSNPGLAIFFLFFPQHETTSESWPVQISVSIPSDSHLFCTLISENQGLEKLRSILNLRKISGPAELNFFSVHLNFFSVCHLNFFQIYTINLKKSRWQTEKKLRCTEKKFRCAGPEIFLRFETDLNFSRPWFSEIKVQIKWPSNGILYKSSRLRL